MLISHAFSLVTSLIGVVVEVLSHVAHAFQSSFSCHSAILVGHCCFVPIFLELLSAHFLKFILISLGLQCVFFG
jgi:hypothetical protein